MTDQDVGGIGKAVVEGVVISEEDDVVVSEAEGVGVVTGRKEVGVK